MKHDKHLNYYTHVWNWSRSLKVIYFLFITICINHVPCGEIVWMDVNERIYHVKFDLHFLGALALSIALLLRFECKTIMHST